MTIVLDGAGLTIEKIVRIARKNEKVELHPTALKRIEFCRNVLEEKIKKREIMYGVNTGIGEFSEVVLSDEQVKEFQKYLVYNHAAGIGDPCPTEYVRGAMTSRINVHAHGQSACRPARFPVCLKRLSVHAARNVLSGTIQSWPQSPPGTAPTIVHS